MASCHGIRCVLLAQVAKDPGSTEKVLRAAVFDAFPEIKVDALPKGKQAVKDYTARLLDRFPSDAARQEYVDTCSSIDHSASWHCEHCTDGKFGYLDGQVGRPSESTGKELGGNHRAEPSDECCGECCCQVEWL